MMDTTPAPIPDRTILETARQVLEAEAQAVQGLVNRLSLDFLKAVRLITACQGRIIVSGIGKSGVVARKLAGTLTSAGIPALFLHPVEALHGDLGVVSDQDVSILLSYSGETSELIRMGEWLRRLDVPIIAITESADSLLAQISQIAITLGTLREVSPGGVLPTTSTVAMMAMSDALAVATMLCRGITDEVLSRLHPGGSIGRRLLRVSHFMHAGDEAPWVLVGTPLTEAVREMSRKGFGCTTVLDETGQVVGIFTDGDLRRTLQKYGHIENLTIDVVMTRQPKSVHPNDLAAEALRLMEKFKITVLVVSDPQGRFLGIVHIHDLWRLQMF